MVTIQGMRGVVRPVIRRERAFRVAEGRSQGRTAGRRPQGLAGTNRGVQCVYLVVFCGGQAHVQVASFHTRLRGRG